MKKIIILCFISATFISCVTAIDNSIKKACSQIIDELGINEREYLNVVEDSISKDSLYYKVWIEVYGNNMQPPEYTDLYKINNTYVIVMKKNGEKKSLSRNILEEIFTFDGDKLHIDAPVFILKINRTNFDYSLIVSDKYFSHIVPSANGVTDILSI